jgi:dihydroxy-acid dehydratase
MSSLIPGFGSPVAVSGDPEDFDKAKTSHRTVIMMWRVGPLGYPGAAEVINTCVPPRLLEPSVYDLPCIGDGRQSSKFANAVLLGTTAFQGSGISSYC